MRLTIETLFALALLLMIFQRGHEASWSPADLVAIVLTIIGLALGIGWAVVDAWGWVFA